MATATETAKATAVLDDWLKQNSIDDGHFFHRGNYDFQHLFILAQVSFGNSI